MTNQQWIQSMDEDDLALFLCNLMTRECCDESCPARDFCGTGRNGLRQWIRLEAQIPEEDGASEKTPCQPYYDRNEEIHALRYRLEKLIREKEEAYDRGLEDRFISIRKPARHDLSGEYTPGC